jgi:uncharacterized protein
LNLDVEELLQNGWCPTPFRQFVVKIHSRCNLSCNYCYMYEMADQSWRSQPRMMSAETVDQFATRIGEHAAAHGLGRVEVVLHGGEPLLAGPALIRRALVAVRAAVDPRTEIAFSVQTNGVLLDGEFLDLFDEFGVRVGVSLDGDAVGHDLHRRFANGHGSHDAVQAGIARLTASGRRHLFGGLLCTIDVRNDPIGTYEALLRHRPPAIDLLLPHGTWENPPPERLPGDPRTPYADWLIAVFDRWYGAGGRETTVRLFNEIIRLLCGGGSRTESVGLSPLALLVIETDGSIEQADTLKSAYEGAAVTELQVSADPFDAALLLPGTVARQIGEAALAAPCSACDIRRVCGGGQYPHRYRPGSGFANSSVYCPDLEVLIRHIGAVVRSDLALLEERTKRQRDFRGNPQ